MDCRIYDPTLTPQVVWDPYTDASGMNYFAMAAIVKYRGKFFFAVGANDGGAEGATGQSIWMKTSDDADTWSDAFQVFCDPNYCTNPIVEPEWSMQWQPGFTVVGDELWCQWNNAQGGYLSKLAEPDGKWTTWRFMFDANDDNRPFLSADLESFDPGEDGTTAWPIFEDGGISLPSASADGVVLSDGRVALPVTFSSQTATETPGLIGAFMQKIKYNGVLFCDGDQWSFTRVDTTLFGDYCAWEPVVVEDPGGHLYVYSRTLNMSGTDDDMFLVASSSDGGQSFTSSVSAKLRVPSARLLVKRVTDRRWIMSACDSRLHSTGEIQQNSIASRKNVSLFMSRRGVPDFIPGVNVSGDEQYTNYPQFCVDGDDLLVVYNQAVGGPANAPTTMKLVRVSPIPDDSHAWVHPRSMSRMDPASPVDPTLVDGPPPYASYIGNNKAVSTTDVTATAGLTFAAWVQWDTTECESIIDARASGGEYSPTKFGQSFTRRGLYLSTTSFLHGETLTTGVPTFLAASIDNSAQTVTLYTAQGGSNFTTKTGYYKSLLFSDKPSDGDTLTIDGVTYTFRTSPSLTNDVAIGGVVNDSTANLATKLRLNSMRPGEVNGGRLLLVRNDLASFSATSGSGVVSVESGMPLDGSHASIGYKNFTGSSQQPWFGRIWDARVYDSALSIANMRSLYNRLATSLGYSSISGTSTTPGTPLLFFDPADRDVDEFPLVGAAPDFDIDGDILTFHGETSASVELPYGATQLTLRYKIGAEPVSSERYVIATFGDGSRPARLYFDADNPNDLYLEDRLVATVADPTAWNMLTVIVSTGKVTIGAVEFCCSGKPRCFLGSGYPQGLLSSTGTTSFDVSRMVCSRV